MRERVGICRALREQQGTLGNVVRERESETLADEREDGRVRESERERSET